DRQRREELLPLYYDADGNEIGRVYYDLGRPFINNLGITDSPRISERNSAALKVDFRPLDGLLLTGSYQIATFADQDATRRFELKLGGRNGIAAMGPDWFVSRDGFGGAELNLDAFDREGVTHTAYLRGSYIKGPWDISGHYSYSTSDAEMLSA